MNGIYLLMGSNMGSRLSYLREAAKLLSAADITILDESSIYETAPWGPADQDWFLNIVLEVHTSKAPMELLKIMLSTEEQLGRVRAEKWGARCIDIDMLYYENQVIETRELQLPHPGIPGRRFTLTPLVEMIPFEVHPVSNKNHLELLAECSDPLDCNLTDFRL